MREETTIPEKLLSLKGAIVFSEQLVRALVNFWLNLYIEGV
jgi:hypothetical protein